AFFDFGSTHNHVDLVLLHQKLDAFAHAVGDTTTALYDGAKIGFTAIYLNAIICGVVKVLEHLGAFEQRFGGDTTPVEADAPEGFPFYNGGFKSKLGSPDGRYITTRSASDYNDVVVHIS